MGHAIKTVGLIFTRKKIERSGFIGLEDYALKRSIRIIHIDLSMPIEDQGKLDLVVHKMTDLVAKIERGDTEAEKLYQRFIKYSKEHPEVIVIDAWPNIEKVLDRMSLYHHTKLCAARDMIEGKPLFHVPKSFALDSVRDWKNDMDIKFPAMCKRRTACSSTEAHQMILIPSKQGMPHIEQYIKDDSVILQEFIQHDGVIVKVYVADGQITASTRPSFKNLDQTADVVHFDSQTLPKKFETNVELSDDLDKVFLRTDPTDIHIYKESLLDGNKLQKIADSLYRQLGLTFFGFDVLLQTKTNAYYVVDVNYFPSFKNVDNFHYMFVDILKKRLGHK
ncbi:inositol-tetrakisphosphate 1-kinase [Gilbertella persicaria]|uniref:inositol-tetrakisphosphate 1-kinase n=1 Tax=Gilbertella persicaria TaxID=101096 RepID=UPI00221F2D00|nr:inositol-tetrakisphosphate 1-kinase [Gilbertella persicaria]KAI8091036.1 inositol-tetrakisphosphate 1-kinase [Gilbertella persicaria]